MNRCTKLRANPSKGCQDQDQSGGPTERLTVMPLVWLKICLQAQAKITHVMPFSHALCGFVEYYVLLQSHIKNYTVFACCVVPSVIIKLTLTCGYIFK